MPRAVIDTEPERKELRTCPGGWVDLKRMPYGDWLHRTDISMQMQIEQDDRRRRKNGNTAKSTIAMQNLAVTSYEFASCIVDHNLEDAQDQKLNFKNPNALKVLDPKVGAEISKYITEMHEAFTEEDEGNFDLSSVQP